MYTSWKQHWFISLASFWHKHIWGNIFPAWSKRQYKCLKWAVYVTLLNSDALSLRVLSKAWQSAAEDCQIINRGGCYSLKLQHVSQILWKERSLFGLEMLLLYDRSQRWCCFWNFCIASDPPANFIRTAKSKLETGFVPQWSLGHFRFSNRLWILGRLKQSALLVIVQKQ